MPRNQAKTVSDLVERFLDHLTSHGQPPSTVTAWRSYLKRFGAFAGDTPLADLDLDDLDDFIAKHYGSYGYSSKRGVVIALRAFYKWAEKRRHASFETAAALDWPRKPRRDKPTFYQPEQVALILNHIPSELDRLIATVLVRQGQRIGRTVSLQWKHIDLANASVYYPPFKTSKGLTIPLDRDTGRQLQAWKALSRYTDPDDWVFVSKRSRLYHRQDDQFRSVLRDACRKAGVPYRGAHEFRRTLATTLLTMGVPLHAVSSSVLGHADIATTIAHYAGIDDEGVADSLRRLPY